MATRATRFVVQQGGGPELCRIELGTTPATHTCVLDLNASQPILFAHLLPETKLTEVDFPLLQRVRLAPAASGAAPIVPPRKVE